MNVVKILDDKSFFSQANNNQFSGETFSSKMNANDNSGQVDDVPF